MNEPEDAAPDLLTRFAEAEADQILLRMILEALGTQDDYSMYDGPIYRAISRAQQEAEQIRLEYMSRGQDDGED